jgi:hypothetical protein
MAVFMPTSFHNKGLAGALTLPRDGGMEKHLELQCFCAVSLRSVLAR